jgi:hypothetical protein
MVIFALAGATAVLGFFTLAAGRARSLKRMSSTAALSVRVHAALLLIAGALAVVVAAAVGPTPGALLTALAASAALAVVVTVAVRDLVIAPAEAALGVGHRAREHRESLDRIASSAHPDTAGRVRSRAPGVVASAA